VVDDPSGGWAKATEETAKASQEAIQATRELAHFVSGPARLVLSMLEDRLSVVWFEGRVRLWERVRQFCADRGMPGPTRKIPLNIAVPLLKNATLEEDDDLQDIWARLFVNCGDADSGIEPRRAFVSVLAEMTLFDVRNLAAIESGIKSNPDAEVNGVLTSWLPEAAVPLPLREDQEKKEKEADTLYRWPQVKISLSNLVRLGCVSTGDGPGGPPYLLVNLTPFGRALIEACTR
jgi:Abortive infection alpha